MVDNKTVSKETQLYEPVRNFLMKKGFRALGEVCGCDVAGWDGVSLVVVELKLTLNLVLVGQAAERQKFADSVWAAISRPQNKWKWKRSNADAINVLKRLGIGLLLVPPRESKSAIDELLPPCQKPGQINNRRRKAILKEMEGRTGDRNTGGCTRTTIYTAYRESTMQIAGLLAQNGPLSPKQLREMGCHQKTQSILYANHYGWFESTARGIYQLTEKGHSDHSQFE